MTACSCIDSVIIRASTCILAIGIASAVGVGRVSSHGLFPGGGQLYLGGEGSFTGDSGLFVRSRT